MVQIYNYLMRAVSLLITLNSDEDSPESELLKKVAKAISEYEDNYYVFEKPTNEEIAAFLAENLKKEE